MILDAAGKIIGCLPRRYCGLCGQAASGASCRTCLAIGTRCSIAIGIGSRPASLAGYLMPPRNSRTWNVPWSRPRSPRFTPANRPLKGRNGHQILVLTDALGNPARFVLLPGQRFDTARTVPLRAKPMYLRHCAQALRHARKIYERLPCVTRSISRIDVAHVFSVPSFDFWERHARISIREI